MPICALRRHLHKPDAALACQYTVAAVRRGEGTRKTCWTVSRKERTRRSIRPRRVTGPLPTYWFGDNIRCYLIFNLIVLTSHNSLSDSDELLIRIIYKDKWPPFPNPRTCPNIEHTVSPQKPLCLLP